MPVVVGPKYSEKHGPRSLRRVPAAEFAAGQLQRRGGFRYGAGASVAAFHRSTTDAVAVLSVFLKPGGGSFANRSK
jgi:hypothetical protein